MTRENTKLLHNLELAALAICWMTFWGGLLFFLGHEKENSVSPGVKTSMTIGLVGTNVLFLLASTFIFFKEFKKDIKMKRRRKTALANGGHGLIQPVLFQFVVTSTKAKRTRHLSTPPSLRMQTRCTTTMSCTNKVSNKTPTNDKNGQKERPRCVSKPGSN